MKSSVIQEIQNKVAAPLPRQEPVEVFRVCGKDAPWTLLWGVALGGDLGEDTEETGKTMSLSCPGNIVKSSQKS